MASSTALGRVLGKPFVCDGCQRRLSSSLFPAHSRAFGTSRTLLAPDAPPASNAGLRGMDLLLAQTKPRTNSSNTTKINQVLSGLGDMSRLGETYRNTKNFTLPYRLHIYATKHNTHITFVQPPKLASQTVSSSISATSSNASEQNKMVDTLISLSAGNLGFRKAGRGTYDAAYQLTAYMLKTMKEKGMLQRCDDIEIVFRGFGAGREAASKAILSMEGRDIRPRIRAVLDATRLKHGGNRAPKPRRLG